MAARGETGYNIGVVGATGLVGEKFLEILETRDSPDLPIKSMRLFASKRSVGNRVMFRGEDHVIEHVLPHPKNFEGLDFVLTAVGDEEAFEYSTAIRNAGGLNVDKSGRWRMHPNVPLVVPEVNPQDAKDHPGIIAGPNCSTIQMAVVLWPLHVQNPIRRITVDTYQAVSGTGKKGVKELEDQTRSRASGRQARWSVYPHQIFSNAIPQIGGVQEDDSYSEETKMVNETKKIFHEPDLEVAATCVRVPAANGHSEAVHIELTEDMSPDEAREVLSAAPGVKVVDDPRRSQYPTPVYVSGKDDTYVGRIRRTFPSSPKGLSMWIVGDNLRKGAALNAVQVFELVARNDWIKGQRS